ncbi:MAG TPA: hypothetical protein VJY85_12055, partial [Candidatus Limnocylindria bacterium]|nr:hypothetical protein [Candidatus Limnocylindria bacterium]
MVSPLELLNQSSYNAARRGVSYMPAVRIPPPRRGPPITPRLVPNQQIGPGTGGDWVTPNFEAIANYAPTMAKQQGGGGGLQGLGWIVGKAGQAGLSALSVLDYPRATINALVSEIAPEIIERMPDAGNYPALDTDFSWGDIGRNIREHKGFGETLVEPIMGPEGSDWNIWVRRALGLAGDIATDPFTYMTVGAGATAGLPARATYLDELRKAQKAATAERTALDAAMEAIPSPANFRRAGAAEKVAAKQEEAWRAAAAARQRELSLGGTEALEMIGRQGVNAASPEQLLA